MKRSSIGFSLAAMVLLLATSGIAKRDAEVTAEIEREAALRKADLRPCDGLWIRQCAAGKCWSPEPPPEACTPSADLTKPRRLPNNILTMPIVGMGKQ
jgi:hypothetical protein